MRTDDLDFELPPESIATEPARPRDAARLLVIRRSDGSMTDHRVRDLPELLGADDVLVVNDTSVHPARLLGRKRDGGGRVEGLFLDELEAGRWRVLLKAGRLREGVVVDLDPVAGAEAVALRLVERRNEAWIVDVEGAGRSTGAILDGVGRTPLPPYILGARKAAGLDVADVRDRADYQTVYADAARAGSIAAPTAGLHFTDEVLGRLEAIGVRRCSVTLHVGEGTFRPVTADTLAEHRMHVEWCSVPPATLQVLHDRAAHGPGDGGPRVIAVGTTSVRTLESLPDPLPPVADGAWTRETDLLIEPGWTFRRIDGMLTNFHLPRSTLIALVAAMLGLDRTMEAYRVAIDRGYRFYSYGDAMLVLP